jgi:hypothetical protein
VIAAEDIEETECGNDHDQRRADTDQHMRVKPAAHDSRSRSKPITLPSAAARTSREMSSTLLNMSGFDPYKCCVMG